METTNQEVKKRPSVWLFISIFLLLACGILVWQLVSTTQEVNVLKVEKDSLSGDKASLIAKLEQLKKEYDQLAEENEGLTEMFEKEKAHVERLLEQIRKTEGSVAKYRGQVLVLETRLKEYEEQIKKLSDENKALVEENFDIKTALDSTILETVDLTEQKNDLTEKVNKGSVLTAYDLIAEGIKVTSRKEIPTLNSKRAEKIRVSFTLGENAIASAGTKDVFIRIADPSGKILSKGDGDDLAFDFNGSKLQYSVKETINYQNKAMDMILYWDKVSDFTAGTYTVDIFVDGNDIATATFIFEK